MQVIENNKFKAVIDEHGAQLTHLYNKEDGNFDYIWNNMSVWPKHAPILFPAIGRSEKDKYFYNGHEYEMPQHGFVAGEDFQVAANDGNQLVLSLADNETTRQYYPFSFKLTITFTLSAAGLTFHFDVLNTDDREFSFALGSHPAFNVPIAGEGHFEDYDLDFEPAGLDLRQFEIVMTPHPYRDGKVIKLTNSKGSHIDLNHEMFKNGLIIIENAGVKGVTLSSPKSKHSVHLNLDDFRYFCTWTKEDSDQPFLCLEPFAGLPDIAGKEADLMNKEGNTKLAAGATKTFEYTITLK